MAKIIDNFVLLNVMNQQTDYGDLHKGKHLVSTEFVTVKVIKIERFVQDNRVREMIL
jgi:serine/threonine-protein kinase ULK2